MFNKKDYLHLKDAIIKHFKKKGYTHLNVAEYASLSGVPLVIIYEYISEDLPEHKEDCEKQIEFIRKYFKY